MASVRELHIQFEHRLREYEDVGLIVETDKLLGYLDRAQEILILQIMREEEVNKSTPEDVLKRIGGTKRFIRVSEPLMPDTEEVEPLAIPNLLSFKIPDDFIYYVESFSMLDRNTSGPKPVKNEIGYYTDISLSISNGTNIPYVRRPKIIFKEGGYVNVIHDHESIIESIQIVYIRKPKKFAFTADEEDLVYTTVTEIDENLVKDIIEIAILSYIQDRNNNAALKQYLGGVPSKQSNNINTQEAQEVV